MSYTRPVLTNFNFQVNDIFKNNTKQFKLFDSNNQSIYIDDTINLLKLKINEYMFSSYNTNSDSLFIWINIDKEVIPISFMYEQNILFTNPLSYTYDINFVDKFGDPKYVSLISLNDLLIKSIFDKYNIKDTLTFNVVHIQDCFSSLNIKKKKYSDKQWPSELPKFDIFYYGFIKKYWPNISKEEILTMKFPKSSKQISTMIKNTNKLMNEFYKEKIDKNIIPCDKNTISLLKITTICPEKDVSINLIRLFSDIELTENMPFSKFILDDYLDTYYKLYKPNIYNNKLTKELIQHWVKDFKKDNVYGYNKYFNYSKVLILKIYVKESYVSLIIHQMGTVEIIFDRTEIMKAIFTNIEFDKNIFEKLIDECNEFLKSIYKSFIGLSKPIQIDKRCLDDNIGDSKVDLINCELRYPKFNWEEPEIHYFYDNLYPFTRKIQEKYFYQLKNEQSIYLRYKRVNNYNNDDTIESIISTLSNPRLGLSKDNIISRIQSNFDLTLEQASDKYEDWLSQAQTKQADNKKYYSIFTTSEPGVETNIIKRIGSEETVVELNGLKSFFELNQIMLFLEISFWIYIQSVNKKLWNNRKLFIVKNTIKETHNSLLNKNEDGNENENNLLDDSPIEIYANPTIVKTPPLNPVDDLNEEEYVDPFLLDLDEEEEDDLIGGGNVNLTRYMIRRLTDSQRDPKLFDFEPLIKTKPYSRICQATPRRQPIVVSNKELKKIDDNDAIVGSKSYFKPPGKDSLKFGSDDKKKAMFNYICPRFWDIEKNISLAPNKKYDPSLENDEGLYNLLMSNKSINPNDKTKFIDQYMKNKTFNSDDKKTIIELLWKNIPDDMWDAREIIPEYRKDEPTKKLNSGKVDQTIYDRSFDNYWRNTDPLNVEDYVISSLGPGYIKEDIDMPCCFTKTTLVKNKKIKKNSKFIVSYQIPSNDNKKGDLNEIFYELIKQDISYYGKEVEIIDTIRQIKDILKKPSSGSIKKIKNLINIEYYQKIEKVESEGIGLIDIKPYGFLKLGVGKNNQESLLLSFSKIFDMSLANFKTHIIKNYTINMFQSSNLPNIFQKKSTLDNLQLFKKSRHLFNELQIPNIDSFFIEINSINTLDNLSNYFELNSNGKVFDYLYKLFISYTNFQKYVKSDEYKQDIYFINIIESLFNVNVIIFEDIFNDIKIKTPLDNFKKRVGYVCLIKKNIYYEPIIFNMELKYSKIDPSIKKIESKLTKDEYNILQRYSIINMKPLFIWKDEINTNYNKESNLYLIKLFQISKSNEKQSSLLSFNDIFNDNKKGIDSILEFYSSKNINIDTIYIDGYNHITHLLTDDKYIIPIQPIYPQETKIKKIYDLSKISIYHSFEEYIKFFKSINSQTNNYKIEGISLENGNTIINILIHGSYVPILPKVYDSKIKYPIKCYIDIRKLDFDIQLHKVKPDLFNTFDDHFTYEQKINNNFNENLVNFIKQNPIFTDTHLVKTNEEVKSTMNKLTTWTKNKQYIELTDTLNDIDYMGSIIDIQKSSNGVKVKLKSEPLLLIQKIIRDTVRVNEDKRILLYSIIYVLSKRIVISDSVEFKKYIESNICYDSNKCNYPCIYNESICKLLINDTSFEGVSLIKKFCWKFVDLLLIYKGDFQELSYYKIEPYELEKTKKRFEYFFTYRDLIDKNILDYLFQLNSDFIHPDYL